MKVIIVDDETSVRNTIATLLNQEYPDIIIPASAGTISEGYEAVVIHHPDLLFLDIELPDGLGFDLLKRFEKINFRIIFITGHQEYALDAIKVSALDYILKPIDLTELRGAVAKAREVIINEEEQMKLQALSFNLSGHRRMKRIILRTADSLQIVEVGDITRAEADSNYTHFYLSGGRHIIVSRTIKEFDAMLSSSGVIRVHQSHLVNLISVDRFMKHDGGYLLLKDGTSIPVSPNLKKKVLEALETYLFE